MEYQGFKSQALDFNVYSDGIDVIAVTPQYALTRENNGTQYYSTKIHPDRGTPGVWTDLTAALADTPDAWWADATFETLLDEYWNTEDNAYPNTLWTREKTEYSSGGPTYSTPTKDAGGSAISQWCLENDRTLINGAHIATGTVTAQQVDAGLLNAAGVVVTSPGSSDPKLDTVLLAPTKSEAQTLDVYTIIQKMPASGTIVDKVVDSSEPAGKVYKYDMTLKDRHGGLRLDLTKLSYNQIYTLRFKFIDLCNATVGATPVTRLGGNTGWPVANFSLLKATIDDSPVTDPFTDPPSTDPSIYSTTGYALTKEAGRTYDIELEFIYLGMNNPGGIDSADNYFYISPNRYFDWSDPEAAYTTYTQIQITDKGISSRPLPEFVPQYILIEQGAYITPTQTDSRWQNEFPDWNGQGSVWYRTVTSTVVKADTLGADDTTIYNYSPPQLLTAGESAKLAAAKAEQAVGDWCKAHNVTILDGSNLMTGTIDANEVHVTNLDASQITAGMFTVGIDTDDPKNGLDEDEIIFQAGYDANKEPQVKIGGFEVDSNSLSTGSDTTKVILKSTVPSNITLEDIPDTAGGGVGVYRYDGNTYVLLSYIESTGKECIDLGIQANTINNATLNFMYTGGVDDGVYDVVYGAAEGLQIARTETGEFTNGDSASDVELELNKRYVCKATYNVGSIGLWTHDRPTGPAIAILTRNTPESTANNVYLFSSGTAHFSKTRIYSCKIWKPGDEVDKPSYNFIPVLQVDTNTPGFYETGTNTFYTNNSGQGGFIAGPIAEVVPRISIALGAEKPNKAPFSVTNTGEVTATKGNISGFNINTLNDNALGLYTEATQQNGIGTGVGLAASTHQGDPAIWAGYNGADGKDNNAPHPYKSNGKWQEQGNTQFYVTNTGEITAKAGTIGGWKIDGSKKTLSSGEGTATVGLNATGSTATPAIWAGTANSTEAPFQVYPTGRLIATSGEIGGFTIGKAGTTEPILYKKITNANGDGLQTVGMAGLNSTDYVTFWAGCPGGLTPWEYNAQGSSYDYSTVTPFYVTSRGYMQAMSGKIGCADIGDEALSIKKDGVEQYKLTADGISFTQGSLSLGTVSFVTSDSETVTYADGKYVIKNVDNNGNTVTSLTLGGHKENNSVSYTIYLKAKGTGDYWNQRAQVWLEARDSNGNLTGVLQQVRVTYYTWIASAGFNYSGTGSEKTLSINPGKSKSDVNTYTATYDIANRWLKVNHKSQGSTGSGKASDSDREVCMGRSDSEITIWSAPISQQRASNNLEITGNLIPTGSGYNLGAQKTGGGWQNLYITGAAYNESGGAVDLSDAQHKNTIEPLSEDYSKLFDELKPVTFKYNIGTSNRLHTGFIAQEVLQATYEAGLDTKDFAAYCEWETEDGDKACGLRYGEFVALNTDQIQKLKARVAELEGTVEELTKLVNEKLN